MRAPIVAGYQETMVATVGVLRPMALNQATPIPNKAIAERAGYPRKCMRGPLRKVPITVATAAAALNSPIPAPWLTGVRWAVKSVPARRRPALLMFTVSALALRDRASSPRNR